jgi:5-methylcytosine-specific restriction endonuclease McrA
MVDTIPRTLRDRIAKTALYRCGYCLTDQRVSGAQMHIEHLTPRARGGASERANLWLSCAWCNSYKGTQTAAIDPDTGDLVSLLKFPRISC